MKRLCFAAAALLCLLPLCGCRQMVADAPRENIAVYASTQPVYLLVNEIAAGAENRQVRRLTQPLAGCPRNYQLSEWDAVLLGGADIVVVAGRGFETYASFLSSGELADGPVVITALDGLDLLGGEEESADEEMSHFDGPNPWLHLSIEGMAALCDSIAAQLAYVDPDNEAVYAHNAEHTIDALDALLAEKKLQFFDVEYPNVASAHEGFAYLAADYGFTIMESIEREPGTDYAGGEERAILERLKAAGIEVVLVEKQAPDRLVRDFEAAGFIVARIDTMTTSMDEYGADAYLKAAGANAQAILAAFQAVTSAK